MNMPDAQEMVGFTFEQIFEASVDEPLLQSMLGDARQQVELARDLVYAFSNCDLLPIARALIELLLPYKRTRLDTMKFIYFHQSAVSFAR